MRMALIAYIIIQITNVLVAYGLWVILFYNCPNVLLAYGLWVILSYNCPYVPNPVLNSNLSIVSPTLTFTINLDQCPLTLSRLF